ncbi:CKLF-like MARVEL transmembrane domain-containing protein 7 isoform X2 [Heterodontus francisci]|uniref:CKLF-like MARVEL transmembrane domain-containing protein 7 isoform X2 n=1 Tax=Heterodontus francisci TaxID=7792 RepID=UPI00355BF268
MPETTTTITRSTGSGFIDRNYARSFSGILKIVQADNPAIPGISLVNLHCSPSMIVAFIAFLCIKCSNQTHNSTYRYFEVVTIWFFVMALVFFIIYLTRLHLKITCMHWPLTEFLHYIVATILLLIASMVGATETAGNAGLAAGVFFGFVSTILYAIGAWLSYKMWCIPQPAISV